MPADLEYAGKQTVEVRVVRVDGFRPNGHVIRLTSIAVILAMLFGALV